MQVHENGQRVSAEEDLPGALKKASQRVGFEVRAPGYVAEGFVIVSVAYEVGPVIDDQDGKQQDLGFIKLATIGLSGEGGQSISIDQLPPETVAHAFVDSPAERLDAGRSDAVAQAYEYGTVTYVHFDSAEFTYVGKWARTSSVAHAEAVQELLKMLKSMN